MAKKPTARRNYKDSDMELNLTPMMNLISILIPVLLLQTVFVDIAVINVSAPALGNSAESPPPEEKPDKPPLNLTVSITDKGYTVAGSGGVLGADPTAVPAPTADGEPAGPTIPVVQRQVSCQKYVGTWPPPRASNRDRQKCPDFGAMLTFWVYDTEALTKKLVEIKDQFPDERRMVIAANPGTEFEAITDVMDAGREHKDPGGELRSLFDEVVLSPGLT
jgi:biopolymer transport protein ExbD